MDTFLRKREGKKPENISTKLVLSADSYFTGCIINVNIQINVLDTKQLKKEACM